MLVTVLGQIQSMSGGLVISVIKEFDPDSEVWCLKFPGRGEVTTFPFCHITILFLFFLCYRFNFQCMFLEAIMVQSPSLSGKR